MVEVVDVGEMVEKVQMFEMDEMVRYLKREGKMGFKASSGRSDWFTSGSSIFSSIV